MKFTIDGVNFSVDEVTGVLSFEGGEIKNAMAADMLIAALTRTTPNCPTSYSESISATDRFPSACLFAVRAEAVSRFKRSLISSVPTTRRIVCDRSSQ